MLDVDGFKKVNDTYGHAVGDEVLRNIADQCRSAMRTIDIVGRYGGEELVILMPETGLSGAEELAERLRRSVADTPIPVEKGGLELTITVSLGVAEAGPDAQDLTDLIHRADQAMYHAKRAGRNRYKVYG